MAERITLDCSINSTMGPTIDKHASNFEIKRTTHQRVVATPKTQIKSEFQVGTLGSDASQEVRGFKPTQSAFSTSTERVGTEI